MSFMYNPFDYDDPNAINKPILGEEVIDSVISGIKESALHISKLLIEKANSTNVVIAMDGYISAQWDQTVNLISQNLKLNGIKVRTDNFVGTFKTSEQLNEELSPYLEVDSEIDPVPLFGKLFDGSYEDLLDKRRVDGLKKKLTDVKFAKSSGEVLIIYGCGCTIKSLRNLYDYIFYYDVTPKRVILRAKNGLFKNLGDLTARPIKEFIRRCYYIDFEIAARLRRDLLESGSLDYYVASDDPMDIKLIKRAALNVIMSTLAKYPLRCKPIYCEGIWGGAVYEETA